MRPNVPASTEVSKRHIILVMSYLDMGSMTAYSGGMKVHTTIDLDRELVREAAEVLGTTRTTETVHAALREVVARDRRHWLTQRDFAGLDEMLPRLRRPRTPDGQPSER